MKTNGLRNKKPKRARAAARVVGRHMCNWELWRANYRDESRNHLLRAVGDWHRAAKGGGSDA